MDLRRRAFLTTLSRVAGATILGRCLDRTVPLGLSGSDPTPPDVNHDLQAVCDPPSAVTLGDLTVSTHPWPRGLDAAAVIDVDDFCPVVVPSDGLDFGGDLTSNGVLRGFLLDQLAVTYPEVKVSLMTIANMRQNPITRMPIAEDDRYLLSRQSDWAAAVREILDAYPSFRLAMHGYWHFNYPGRNAAEFNQYSDLQARAVMGEMHREFLRVFPMVEPVFRAPGWVSTPGVLEYVAAAGLLLADSSATTTFKGSVPSCETLRPTLQFVRAGPDYSEWITQEAQSAGLIVGHFHFTAPNKYNLGSDLGRQTALGFARDIRNATAKYRIEWFSYHEAARSVALANSVKWAAVLDGNTLRITVGSWATPLQDVTLAVQNLAGRDVAVESVLGDPIPFRLSGSARGCDYIVLAP